MSTQVKEEINQVYKNKKLKVTPIIKEGAWRSLLVNGENVKQPPLFPDCHISLTVPKTGPGQVKRVLDNTNKIKYEKYSEKLTEQEFFERELGKSLNPYVDKEGNNFWMDDPSAFVDIPREGMTLDMSNPLDIIRYKVLQSNHRIIADIGKDVNYRTTYVFSIIDEEEVLKSKTSERNLRKDAVKAYYKIEPDAEKLKDFLRVAGRGIAPGASKEWLENETYKIVESSPKFFLTTLEDPMFTTKLIIAKGVAIKEIFRTGKERYKFEDMEFNNQSDLITWLRNDTNSLSYTKLKQRIQNSSEV